MNPPSDKKLISIVTISFNSINEGLNETLSSVFEAKSLYDGIEYIVIDGDSTDGSKDVYAQYSEHIDFFVSEKDKGISDAFNKGVNLATGKFIWFVNSGDYLNINALDNIIATLNNTENDIIFGNMYWVDNNKKELLFSNPDYQKKISYIMPFMHPSTIVSKKVFNKIGLFDLRLKRAMDYDLFIRAHLYGFVAEKVDVSFSYMASGGTHDISYHKTVFEVMKVSIFSGGNCVKATFWMLYTYSCQKSVLFQKIKKIIKKYYD